MLFLSDMSMAEESNWFYDILVLIFSEERAEIFAKYIEKFGLSVALVFIVIILFLLYKHKDKLTLVFRFIKRMISKHAPKPPRPVPSTAPSPITENYLVREGEENKVKALLKDKHKVILSAVGGLGKTTLTTKLYYDLRNSYTSDHWVNYNGNMTDSLLSGFPEYQKQGVEPAQQLEQILAHLNSEQKPLLIIDNVDDLHDEQNLLGEFRKIASLDVLLTSRMKKLVGYEVHPLETLTTKEARTLFYTYCERFNGGQDNMVDKLTALVEYNTLGVELLAKSVPSTGTLEDFYILLTERGFGYSDTAVKTAHQNQQKKSLAEHLHTLYTITKRTEEEQRILHNLAFMPTMALPAQVTKWIGCTGENDINRLVESGWLSRRFEANGACYYRMHPIVKETILLDKESFPAETGAEFVEKLSKANQIFDPDEAYDTILPKIELADGFLQSWRKWNPAQTEQVAKACHETGYHCLHRALYQKAVEWIQIAVGILETILPESASLATAYNNLGSAYGYLGDHQKALQYLLDALDICKKVLPPDHPSLATSYNNLGSAYGDLGDHQKALQYLLDALDIRKKVLPPDHPSLATSYNNVGYTYGYLGDHQKELQYQLNALRIWQKVLPPDHPDLASSYHNVGATLYQLDRYQEAREHLLKAVKIREARPECRFDLPSTYDWLSDVETALGNTAAAERYRQKYLTLKQQLKNERNA